MTRRSAHGVGPTDRLIEGMRMTAAAPRNAVGLTATVPVEILYAAGRRPLDLNNVFAAAPDAADWLAYAERRGFPAGTCAWIKGLYAAVHRLGIREMAGVVEGDCQETSILLEILASEGVTVHPFAFPASRRPEDFAREIGRFADAFGVTPARAGEAKRQLDEVRRIGREAFDLSADGRVPGGELFSTLLALSDFGGDPETCRAALTATVARWRALPAPDAGKMRVPLACAGVPTILSDLWDAFEAAGGRFVDFEMPRQFSLIDQIGRGLVESYAAYTYPASTAERIAAMRPVLAARGVRGLMHYVQSFCHRQLGDRLWREALDLPILTLEADRPGRVDERTRTRIEAFMERF